MYYEHFKEYDMAPQNCGQMLLHYFTKKNVSAQQSLHPLSLAPPIKKSFLRTYAYDNNGK